jgi:hypothetical protein
VFDGVRTGFKGVRLDVGTFLDIGLLVVGLVIPERE